MLPSMPSLSVSRGLKCLALASLLSLPLTGCSGRPGVLPHSDPALRKSSAEFSAESARRYPYKADAPRGDDAQARAQVGYSLNRIDIANLSDTEWTDVEVWINGKYVVVLPTLPPGELRSLNFQMIFDDSGHYFPLKNDAKRPETMVNQIEILRDGVMYTVPLRLAD